MKILLYLLAPIFSILKPCELSDDPLLTQIIINLIIGHGYSLLDGDVSIHSPSHCSLLLTSILPFSFDLVTYLNN